MSMKQAVFFAPTRVWVGECPQEATHWAEVPLPEDPRWIQGRPTVLDTCVLTLSPFYSSQQLGVCAETKPGSPLFRHPNHPPFEGAVAWMLPDCLEQHPMSTLPMWGLNRRQPDASPSP